MNDRIKLAEAMGWTPLDHKLIGWWMPPGVELDDHLFMINRKDEAHLPDPFTDANDDYVVLEWMRKFRAQDMSDYPDGGYLIWARFCEQFGVFGNYKIGDYARAALKVLENQRLLRAAQQPCPLA